MNISEIVDLLAATRAEIEPEIAALEDELTALKTRLAERRAVLQQAEDLARAAVLLNLREEGEMNPDDDAWVVKTERVRYNRDYALTLAKAQFPSCVRVKEELRVREFDSLVAQWIAESADIDPQLDAAIEPLYIANISSRLGHRLIKREVDQRGTSND